MKKKILVKGPAFSQSGYGEQTRFALRSLRQYEEALDIYLQPISWGKTGWIHEDNEERAWLDGLMHKTQQYNPERDGPIEVSLQVTIPNEWEKIAPINIGYTAGIETTKVSPQWIQQSTLMDRIIVVSNHSKNVYENSVYMIDQEDGMKAPLKCMTPIAAVNYCVLDVKQKDVELNLDYDFNFLTVAQWGPRKNVPNTVKWFMEEFKDEEVGLVLKTNLASNSIIDKHETEKRLKQFMEPYEDFKCKLYLLHGDMTREEMTGLYNHSQIKAILSLTHGEGFGLPMFEGAYNGLPVITTEWSGQADFLFAPVKNKNSNKPKRRPLFARVDYDLKPVPQEAVWEGVVQAESSWCYPKENSAKQKMRDVYKNHTRYVSQAKKLKAYLLSKFTPKEQYAKFASAVLGKDLAVPEEITGISFCIPTNGKRPEATELTIKSIMQQEGAPYEIILCGDVNNFAGHASNSHIGLVDASEEAHSRRVATLRNKASEQAKYDAICYLDDDIILSPDWMQETIKYSKENGWNVLSNRILNPDGGRYWDRATIAPIHRMVGYDFSEYNSGLYQTSCFLMVRKNVFEKVRWDDTKLVYADQLENQIPEDVQFSADILEAGYSFSFNKNALVWHNDDRYCTWNKGNMYAPHVCMKKEWITDIWGVEFFPPQLKDFNSLVKELESE